MNGQARQIDIWSDQADAQALCSGDLGAGLPVGGAYGMHWDLYVPPPAGESGQSQRLESGRGCLRFDDSGSTGYLLASFGGCDFAGAPVVLVHAAPPAPKPPVVTPPPAPKSPGAAPSIIRPPSIGGHPASGGMLKAGPGSWTGSGSVSYQWQRCKQGSCKKITSKGMGAAYMSVKADQGFQLRARVSAKGPGGTTAALTPLSRTITAAGCPADPYACQPSFDTTGLLLAISLEVAETKPLIDSSNDWEVGSPWFSYAVRNGVHAYVSRSGWPQATSWWSAQQADAMIACGEPCRHTQPKAHELADLAAAWYAQASKTYLQELAPWLTREVMEGYAQQTVAAYKCAVGQGIDLYTQLFELGEGGGYVSIANGLTAGLASGAPSAAALAKSSLNVYNLVSTFSKLDACA